MKRISRISRMKRQRRDLTAKKERRGQARVGSGALILSNLSVLCVFAVITLSSIREIRVIS